MNRGPRKGITPDFMNSPVLQTVPLTLGEIVVVERSNTQDEWQTDLHGATRMTLSRRPAPYPPHIETSSTPFELINIKGPISSCAARCGVPIKETPHGYTSSPNDKNFCVRHKENYHYIRDGNWVPKFGNKHYHVNMHCLTGRNPSFNPNLLRITANIDANICAFLTERLGL